MGEPLPGPLASRRMLRQTNGRDMTAAPAGQLRYAPGAADRARWQLRLFVEVGARERSQSAQASLPLADLMIARPGTPASASAAAACFHGGCRPHTPALTSTHDSLPKYDCRRDFRHNKLPHAQRMVARGRRCK